MDVHIFLIGILYLMLITYIYYLLFKVFKTLHLLAYKGHYIYIMWRKELSTVGLSHPSIYPFSDHLYPHKESQSYSIIFM